MNDAMHRTIIGIMGPGEQATETQCQDAYELGVAIAQAGWVVLTGGRNAGVMEAACRGAKAAGGLTVGILPGTDERGSSAAIDIPIYTGLGHARNAINVLSSRVVVACGMGPGTVSEVALALKSGKSTILLKPDETSREFFYNLSGGRIKVADQVATVMLWIEEILAIA